MSAIQGAADGEGWWGNDCPLRAPGWEMNIEGGCWELSRARVLKLIPGNSSSWPIEASNLLPRGSQKCSPWTSSINTAVRNAYSKATPQI